MSFGALLDSHDGLGLAALIRAGEVASGELLEAVIARIEVRQPRLRSNGKLRWGSPCLHS